MNSSRCSSYVRCGTKHESTFLMILLNYLCQWPISFTIWPIAKREVVGAENIWLWGILEKRYGYRGLLRRYCLSITAPTGTTGRLTPRVAQPDPGHFVAFSLTYTRDKPEKNTQLTLDWQQYSTLYPYTTKGCLFTSNMKKEREGLTAVTFFFWSQCSFLSSPWPQLKVHGVRCLNSLLLLWAILHYKHFTFYRNFKCYIKLWGRF